MPDQSYLSWPFFEENHRAWAANVQHVAATLSIDHSDPDAACRSLVSDLGANGILAPTSSDDQSFIEICLAVKYWPIMMAWPI